MTWRPGAKALLATLALLALVATPLAIADHAYSHRYVVWGRVVDAEGHPVPGLTVDLGYEKPFNPEGPCANQPGTETDAFGPTRTNPVTNQFGEFVFCFHHHSMSRTAPGKATLRIESLAVEKHFDFDAYTRTTFVPVKLETTQADANKTILDTEYTVQGRVWRGTGSDIRVESIRVYGDTIHNKPANITFSADGQEPVTVQTITNNYGDFSVRIPVASRPAGGKVTLQVENETFSADIDPALGATSFDARMPKVRDPFVAKFLIGLGITAAVIVGGGALWYTSSRVKTAREERVLREGSGRKRANK